MKGNSLKISRFCRALSFVLAAVILAGGLLFLPNTDTRVYADEPETTEEASAKTLPPFDPNIGGEGVKGFIGRLYVLGLGREIVVNDSNYYLQEINSGRKSGGQVAKIILTSNEFKSFNYSDSDFVEVLYRVFFNRQSAGASRDYWLGVVATTDRARVIDMFINTVEWRGICADYGIASGAPNTPTPRPTATNTPTPHQLPPFDPNIGGEGVKGFIGRLYVLGLGRNIVVTDSNYYLQEINSGRKSGGQVAKIILTSNEFKSFNYSDSDFVEVLYRVFFNRQSSGASRDYWLSVVATTDRARVIDMFINTVEWKAICADYGIASGAPNTPTPRPANERIVVASYNSEIQYIGEEYLNGTGVNVSYVQIDINEYQNWLDRVLASGDSAPDIYVMDTGYAQNYFNSSMALSMNDLGITAGEMSAMYPYTRDFATGTDGKIYGLAYNVCPSVVFYNRVVAQQYLGVSTPNAVAPYFATWDAVLSTARTVKTNSSGRVHITSGVDDMNRLYEGSRTTPWMVNGQLNTNNAVISGVFDFTKTLMNEGLTGNYIMWGDAWAANMTNHKVLSYWGPMWLGRFSMGLDTTYNPNPTSGEWNIVKAPASTFWGGTYLSVSRYAKVASSARFLRLLTMNTNILTRMALDGEVVNNSNLNRAFASDSRFNCSWLNNQNPISILHQTASTIPCNYSVSEQYINEAFSEAVYQITPTTTRTQFINNFRNYVNNH